ncbi:Uncharacterised protein [Mycobacteroides abscessus subsp. abscessus]|nr:Uncharacterised protein [Mycobacteroides abscessus subsp. abscessus]
MVCFRHNISAEFSLGKISDCQANAIYGNAVANPRIFKYPAGGYAEL